MEINMKDYNLESFKDKDLYTWDEIISVIEDLEAQIEALQEEVDNLKDPDYGKPDPFDEYMENRFQNE